MFWKENRIDRTIGHAQKTAKDREIRGRRKSIGDRRPGGASAAPEVDRLSESGSRSVHAGPPRIVTGGQRSPVAAMICLAASAPSASLGDLKVPAR